MARMTIRIGIGLLALVAISACASHGVQRAGQVKQCRATETLTCDRFAGENYNCSCQRGDNLREILDPYKTR